MKILDLFKNEIKVGDIVVYPGSSSNMPYLNFGRVTKLDTIKGIYEGSIEEHVYVQGASQWYSYTSSSVSINWKKNKRVGKLKVPSRIMVLHNAEATLPKELLDLLLDAI